MSDNVIAIARSRGRPRSSDPKNRPIGVRVNSEVYSALKAAADSNGWSMSREAEFRITEALRVQDLLPILQEISDKLDKG